MTAPIVIIGAGQAGLKAAETLCAKGYDKGIVLIGEEATPPYQRPPLSKAFLKGEMAQERLMLRPPAFFETGEIDLRLNTSVAAIDAGEDSITLSGGATLTYSKLLIATGTRARMIPIKGGDLEAVYSLRTIADVDAIRPALNEACEIAILGGGYIGLEFAAVAARMGKSVTVVESRPRVLERSVAPEISSYFQRLHEANGVKILLGRGVERICGTSCADGVALSDGSILKADLVLLAVGAVPVTELAEKAGLAVGTGIAVDALGRTSAEKIFAAGDCTEFPSKRYGRTIRLESVQNAVDQAKHAAGTMMGHSAAYDPVPWFWSDQYETKLQIAGLSGGFDRTEAEGDVKSDSFALRYFKDDRLIAVDAVNQPRAHMLARRALQSADDPQTSTEAA